MGHESLINKDRLLNTFLELISINSPSFEEKEIGEYISKKLEACGCRVEFQRYDKSFNLIGFRKGSYEGGPALMLSGHMDTIEPTTGIKFENDGEVIKSVGETVLGADDKGALAQIIEAVTVLHENGLPHADLEVVFTSAEEKGLSGAKNLDYEKLRSKHALVLDYGGNAGGIVVAAPSHTTYEMKVTGRSAHAGIEPERGISAIRVAAEIISALPDGRIDDVTTANVGIIRGGTATNVVPKQVAINGEIRSHGQELLEKLRKSIDSTASRIAEKHGARVEIEWVDEYRTFTISENDPFLRFVDETFRKCSISPVHVLSGGGSDANIFNQSGITAVNIANGMMKVHSPEEEIGLADLYDGCRIVLAAAADFGPRAC